ncbi:hypothetical protein SAMN05216350_102178 [Polaromonas sp. YR568]|uniref:hypothetical protein n=1 Tax=Polaromonas sp. YR568 TaxID=1855301 RepID=UPI0008E175C7|nr:hypothetical protein [Polaromonas sp. YR568]SFU49387.1 hypothetical protein SAMN05216350_102178 [Polaromonas sp. YR568]
METTSPLRGALITALLALSCLNVQALGKDYPYDAFTTPDAVSWVQMCGSWGKDNQGTYRVLHADQYAQSFLYIQWMTRDANGSLHAEHTVGIAEMNNDHSEIALSGLACRATPQGIALTARASSGHDDKLRRVTIEAGPATGQYRYRTQRAR